VFANDIHHFATTIARALLVAEGPVPSVRVARKDLLENLRRNYEFLKPIIATRVEKERQALRVLVANGHWKPLFKFINSELEVPSPRRFRGVATASVSRADGKRFPYFLCSSYYASGYFGVEQSAMIDSLRYAIDLAPETRRGFYLTALLHAVSHCGSAPGHFAQFFTPHDEKSTMEIARYRTRSVLSRFASALAALQLPACLDRPQNEVFRSDATAFVGSLAENQQGEIAIYADPPYSRAQYSRYYHVLETLILYDYPEVTGKGRYRTDRINTDFSRKARVVKATDTFIAVAASVGPLFLSYPANGLLHSAGVDPLDLLSKYYANVGVLATAPIAHSTLGGAPGTAAVNVIENVYYAH
jgi:adenine-specific DNA-methyltransferase